MAPVRVDPPESPETIAPHFASLLRVAAPSGVVHDAPQKVPDPFAAVVLELDV